MVNEKIILPQENIYKTEEVRYLEIKEDSRFTKFLKKVFPEVHCMEKEKIKRKSKNSRRGGAEIDYGSQHLIGTINNKWGESSDWWDENAEVSVNSELDLHSVRTSAGASAGAGGAIASGSAEYSMFKINGPNGSSSSDGIKFLSGGVGGEIGAGIGGVTAQAQLGVDLAKMEAEGFRARVGLNADTGGSIGPGGVEVKAAGFGISVGKKMGVSLPIGEISVDLEEACVIQ